MAQKILAWSECQIQVGTAGETVESWTSIGTIKDKSATLSSEDGDTLEMKSTGGHLVGYEKQEGTMSLVCTVIEPDTAFYTLFGIGTSETNDIKVTTHVVETERALKVIPKNVGAYGIEAPYTSVSIKTGWSEEEGNYAEVTFGILNKVEEGGATYWYKKVKKA